MAKQLFDCDGSDYNVLEEIENLINRGYNEEQAEEVALLGNYNIPLEEIFDYPNHE